ncbi:hypothetical protein F442_17590 [Phytophthora nicotianae P10297]|uniref:Uncharacterized protein n=1 Tax=Phytophthora nicotianae P10297 TaxID=1317064 RepID=W2YGB6_PHYNI|nr:hypothetical protein F442_17590 [Phytophthora nicotianae P10297]
MVGPPIVIMYLRCGWSRGGVQDRYLRYKAAADDPFLGRVVARLPLNSAVLPPHFKEYDSVGVVEGMQSLFPNLFNDRLLQSILKLCLVLLVCHHNSLAAVLRATHA